MSKEQLEDKNQKYQDVQAEKGMARKRRRVLKGYNIWPTYMKLKAVESERQQNVTKSYEKNLKNGD